MNLHWNGGEPHVMLDKSFCPGWGVGCTASLRLWILHKDGSMSHFYPLEEDTWRKDFDRQSDRACIDYPDVWTNWPQWQERWKGAVLPCVNRMKAGIKWKI